MWSILGTSPGLISFSESSLSVLVRLGLLWRSGHLVGRAVRRLRTSWSATGLGCRRAPPRAISQVPMNGREMIWNLCDALRPCPLASCARIPSRNRRSSSLSLLGFSLVMMVRILLTILFLSTWSSSRMTIPTTRTGGRTFSPRWTSLFRRRIVTHRRRCGSSSNLLSCSTIAFRFVWTTGAALRRRRTLGLVFRARPVAGMSARSFFLGGTPVSCLMDLLSRVMTMWSRTRFCTLMSIDRYRSCRSPTRAVFLTLHQLSC